MIFCWLPPENFARLEKRVGGAHVKFLHLRLAAGDHRFAVKPEALAERLIIVPAEDAGFGGIKSSDEAAVLAVLRHMGKALFAHMARIAQNADILAFKNNLARGGLVKCR